MLSLVWFKRDLRTADHAPLSDALADGACIGLYAYEPSILNAPEQDACHLDFINHCLEELRHALASLNCPLLVLKGEMPELLNRLYEQVRIDRLLSYEETGLGVTYERDKRVARWARQRGITWKEYPQHGVVRRLEHRDGWSRRWLECMRPDPLPEPKPGRPLPTSVMKALPDTTCLTPESLSLEPSTKSEAQPGGRQAGLTLLNSFLHERGRDYQQAMSSPLEGADACSRLSPHFAYGTLSIREAYHASNNRLQELKGKRGKASLWRSSVQSFSRRLRWQSHFIQKLEDEPDIEFRNINRTFDGLRNEDPDSWSTQGKESFDAWCRGQTGYPMIDACMRCLHTTGWINFRMRAMLMSFASYHLWLHWRPTAQYLARQFVDFEPGIHYSQAQMQSGVTGINTVRIYSPIKQAQDQDPKAIFIRRWIPELRELPDESIHQPEACPLMIQAMSGCEIGRDYPQPIVEHKTAYRTAQSKIFQRRSSPGARQEAQRVYLKHGSRRRPHGTMY
ncbi:MAG: deoxyribodipyrimidine photo-lyase [Phycisphaeraceae bacterium]